MIYANLSYDEIVRLGEKRLYCSDARCYILTADPADVVNL